MNLSPLQQEAFDRIKEFVDSENEQIFILKGYAGTGKTFLINTLTNYFDKKSISYLLCAPTGKAARILSNKCDIAAKTLHSLIYAYDEQTNLLNDQSNLNFLLKRGRDEETVFVVDEASMITDVTGEENFLKFGSGSLLIDFFDFIEINEANSKNKVIFVGDPAQLPPVSSTFSPALSAEYLTDKFGLECTEFTLTEIFRQAEDSGILLNAFNIRERIESNIYDNFELRENENVKKLNAAFDFRINMIMNSMKRSSTMMITYTNNLTHKYNHALRTKIFDIKDSYTDILRPGERLLVNTNNQFYDVSNGDIIEVVSINGEVEKHTVDKIPLEFVNVTAKFANFTGGGFDCKLCLNLLKSHEKALTYEERNSLFTFAKSNIDVPYPNPALKKKKRKEYEEKLKKFKEALKESPYYNALQVKYGYAITCHKAQGGEWDTVFVDFSGFREIANENFYRWAYTAITRAAKNLYLINTPYFNAYSY